MLLFGAENRAASQLKCSGTSSDQVHFESFGTRTYSCVRDIISIPDGCLRVEFCAAHERQVLATSVRTDQNQNYRGLQLSKPITIDVYSIETKHSTYLGATK